MVHKKIPLFISIRSKIYAVIGTVTLFAFVLALVSWALFQTFSNTLYVITRESNPTSLTASKLEVLSADLNLDVNKALSSRNEEELSKSFSRMLKHIIQMRTSLDYIQSLVKEDLKLGRIYDELSKIENFTNKINKYVLNSIDYNNLLLELSKRNRKLQNQFIILVTPISDDALFSLSTLNKESISASFLEKKSTFLAYSLELKSEGNLIFGVLNVAENLLDIDSLAPLKERFNASRVRLEEHVKLLLEHNKGQETSLTGIQQSVKEMIDSGMGKNNVFQVKKAQLLNKMNLIKLKDAVWLSTNKISAELVRLEKKIKKQSAEVQENAEEQIIIGKSLMFIIAFLSIVISFFVGWWIVGRNITQRLEELRESMMEVSSGNLDATIPHTGMDEVAQMGNALSVFKDKMISLQKSKSRENLLMNMLYQGSSAANNADSFEDAAAACLRLITTYACWTYGHMYIVNGKTRTLESANIWSGEEGGDFKNNVSKMTFRLGEGLPGRVMSINKSDYIKNIRSDDALLRGKILKDAGIKSVYAYPIRTGSKFFGVVEFFSTNEFKFDKGLNETIENIFTQLGISIQRLKTEEDLRLEKEKAEAATYAKGNFLANMSHEIRTPLNAVLGMVDLILESQLKAEQRYWAKTIKTSGDSLLDIINDILDFSKIEAQELLLESIPFNIHKVIEEIFELIRMRAIDQGIEIYSIIEPDVPAGFMGDPGRVRQIIINLLGNAIKFTKSGHVALRISVIQDLKHSTQLKFDIEDTGVGIQKNKIDYIFNTFSQAEESTSRQFGGTGLGLSICKKLVELMGGNIGVTSEFGEGSNFFFNLALKKHDLSKEEKYLKKYKNITLKGQKALVLEEDGLGAEAMKKYLTHLSISSEIVHSQEQCIKILMEKSKKDFHYDYIFVNSKLIDNNPISFGHILKDIKGTEKSFKIHLVDALYMIDEKEIMPHLDAQLTKPLQLRMLNNCLRILTYSRNESKPIKKALNPALIDSLIQGTDGPVVDQSERFKGVHILIVEDMKANMVLLSTILKKLGVTVSTAVNGKEAVEKFEESDFSMIFMDCQMPEMDGFEATQKIRKITSKPQCPIVALTANAMQGDKDKCLAAGMDDYLNKPLRKDKLIEAIERWGVAPASPLSEPHLAIKF